MRKILFVLPLIGYQLTAQTAISGKVHFDGDIHEPKVYLAKLDIEHIEDLKYAESIAWSTISTDGTFSFDKKHIADKDAIYHIYLNRVEKAVKDTISEGATFILSNSDEIDFSTNDGPFVDYNSSNLADGEWKKLKAFEAELSRLQLTGEENAEKYKSYAKDSLRILLVKLIGIKQLEKKQLLDRDIAKNPEFYLTFLDELRASEMPDENYAFLERRLAFLTQEIMEEKYARSKVLNIFLGLLVVGLVGVVYVQRKRKPAIAQLSRQEQNIRNLMVQGMTNKEIAGELFISLSTVKTHITNIYSKLKVSDRKELLQKNRN